MDQGGVRLNDQPVKAATASVTAADLDQQRHRAARRG